LAESCPLSWDELASIAPPLPSSAELAEGPTSPQASLRLFGASPDEVRVTLFRDHHAWCPYCQKVWLWLEERRIPYRIRKVTMFCYGEKERWYTRLVPSGMLPALELDGRVITESDRILLALEQAFGALGPTLNDPAVLPLRQLERLLFRAWCSWLCQPHATASEEQRAAAGFEELAGAMAEALTARPGPFFFGDLSAADLVFVPYVERMSASLAYYKGYLLRHRHPAIERWFAALESRPTYLGTQSDFHTHAHDLPPQMGGCFISDGPAQQRLADRIDRGPWPITSPDARDPAEAARDPETSQVMPAGAGPQALARVLKHRSVLLERNPLGTEGFDLPLRCALTHLVSGAACVPPPGSAAGLRYLCDRISVPRDMPLLAARQLRRSLEATALLDAADPQAPGPALPQHHRRDQDPEPFLRRSGPA
jgi:glutathione S-transferase